MQINRDNIHINNKMVDNYYKFGERVMLDNHDAYKYETPYNFSFVISHCLPMEKSHYSAM